MRRLILLVSFFVITPVLLVFSAIFYSYLSYLKNPPQVLGALTSAENISYAALPTNQNLIEQSIEQKDARVANLQQFFTRYQSPLEPYAQDIIDSADYYDLDWKLVPAIAMQESNLCKKIPKDSYNCWGFGIYGSKVTRFTNYQDAIKIVTKTLATEYKEKRGLETPSEIMTRYTPSNTGAWAYAVSHFINVLEIP